MRWLTTSKIVLPWIKSPLRHSSTIHLDLWRYDGLYQYSRKPRTCERLGLQAHRPAKLYLQGSKLLVPKSPAPVDMLRYENFSVTRQRDYSPFVLHYSHSMSGLFQEDKCVCADLSVRPFSPTSVLSPASNISKSRLRAHCSTTKLSKQISGISIPFVDSAYLFDSVLRHKELQTEYYPWWFHSAPMTLGQHKQCHRFLEGYTMSPQRTGRNAFHLVQLSGAPWKDVGYTYRAVPSISKFYQTHCVQC